MVQLYRSGLWSANGFANHKHEVEVFSQLNIIDLLVTSETHFTSKSQFKIKHYNLYYTLTLTRQLEAE